MDDEQIRELWMKLQNAETYEEAFELLKEALEDARLELGGTGDRDE